MNAPFDDATRCIAALREPTVREVSDRADEANPDRRVGERRRGERRRQAVAVRPTHVRVDAAALEQNLKTVASHIGERGRVLAVVKADGYGHGAVESARAFADAGAWGLAVSLIEEGVELRVAGLHVPIVVLGGVHRGSEDVVVHRGLTPVVWERRHLDLLSSAVMRAGAPAVPVHLKVDTGMSRLGARPEEIGELLDWFVNDAGRTLDFEGVMTHLARADESGPEARATSDEQLERFRDCLGTIRARGLRPRLRHVCNSAGLVRLPHASFDMVRPGMALYGAASGREVELPGIKPGMSWHSRVLGIRALPKGASITYGHRDTLTRDSKLAIVPVGYGDGYRRNMSGRAEVLIRGHRCKVLGNITMDVSMVDVTDLPDAREGEEVCLMGKQGREELSVYDLAQWAGVLPYEVVCGVSKRVPRR